MDIPASHKDKFIKLRPLYDILKKLCIELSLEKNLLVDEQIVPSFGQAVHSWKTNIEKGNDRLIQISRDIGRRIN